MRIAAVIAGTLAAACGVDVENDATLAPPALPPPAHDGQDTSVESLRALGYADWDDTATEDRATVTVHVPGRVQAWPRAWADDRDLVHVIDVDGAPLRTITVPGRTQVEFARFLQGGRIACVSVDEGLTLLESDGALVWHFDAAGHHDVAVLPDGRPPGQRTFALAVHGAREWHGRQVRFDEVVFVDERTGRLSASLPTWSSFAHRESLLELAGRDHPLDRRAAEEREGEAGSPTTIYDYFHLNSIAFEGAGTMLVCLRNVDLVAWIDLETGVPGRGVGPGVLDWPHAPALVVRDGTPGLLAFDNGYHRGWSRALEVDSTSGEVLWEYRGTAADPLFSATRGFVQRLPNGNTLITESERGRALEVTDDGEVVWEFWNPETREAPDGRVRRRIYRMTAVPPQAAPAGVGQGR